MAGGPEGVKINVQSRERKKLNFQVVKVQADNVGAAIQEATKVGPLLDKAVLGNINRTNENYNRFDPEIRYYFPSEGQREIQYLINHGSSYSMGRSLLSDGWDSAAFRMVVGR